MLKKVLPLLLISPASASPKPFRNPFPYGSTGRLKHNGASCVKAGTLI